jgi:hypothetical protein
MSKEMTVGELYNAFVRERMICSDEWDDYANKEVEALMIGDHGTAAECRMRVHQAKRRYTEISKVLDEIYRKAVKMATEQDSA